MSFTEVVEQERERLVTEKEKAKKRIADAETQLRMLDREINALNEYVKVTKGSTPRRKGVRQAVLQAIQQYPDGIRRADLLVVLGAKDDSAATRSVSNALTALASAQKINKTDDGHYRAA